MSEEIKTSPGERSVRDAAENYRQLGLHVVPVDPISKRPKGREWQKREIRLDEFAHGAGVGVVTGRRSGNLCDLDLDFPEAARIADVVCEDMPAFGHPGNPRSHRLFRCPDLESHWETHISEKERELFPGLNKTRLVEVRGDGTGLQTVFPPTMHEHGRREWGPGTLADVPTISWEAACHRARLCTALGLIVRVYPRGSGHRDDVCMALSGVLIASGIDSDEEVDPRGKAAATRAQMAADLPCTGLPKLCDLLGIQAIEPSMREWLGIVGRSAIVADTVDLASGGMGAAPVLSRADPAHAAAEFRRRVWPHVVFYQADWLVYDGRSYRATEDVAVEVAVRRFLESALTPVQGKNGKPIENQPFRPRKKDVAEVVSALVATCHADEGTIKPPCWLTPEPGDPPASEIMACSNGLLHVPTLRLLPHTPRFFTRNALDLVYDPSAPEPARWMQFLSELWPGDAGEIALLQESLGYLLLPDNSLQKMFLLLGARRGGKGTIMSTAKSLVGEPSTCGLTLTDLCTPSGRANLLGRTLCIVDDFVKGTRSDEGLIVGLLKSITGGGLTGIHRMYIGYVNVVLPVRFMISANAMPKLHDPSETLADRFVVLRFDVSFSGREDPELEGKLRLELPGILLWALAGRRRLMVRGRFAPPKSSLELMSQMRDLGGPVAAFVREHCVVDTEGCVPIAVLHTLYGQEEAKEQRFPTAKNVFSSEVVAAFPTVRSARRRVGEGGAQVHCFLGLRLREPERPEPY